MIAEQLITCNVDMTIFNMQDILTQTGGTLISGKVDASFSGVSIDSRNIEQGNLFWAIKGERYDGNNFINEAQSNGATGIVTELDGDLKGQCAIIKVDSSLTALQSLAAFNRSRHSIPLVALTESKGKTSTKEIL